MDEIRIEQLMTKEVTCVGPNTELTEVVHLMCRVCHGCIVVIEKKAPVGVITGQDLFCTLADVIDQSRSPIICVSEIMSSPPVALNLSATLFKALAISRSRMFRHFPVVNEEGEIIGLVKQSDLIRAHFRVIEKQREIIERSVISRTQALHKANYEMKELALEDGFLEIRNRRVMEVDLQHTHETVIRYKRPYSVAPFDIDDFKGYNDTYGRFEGDKVLKRVTDHLQLSIRQSDRLYRYGVEEFLLLLPETTSEQADVMARRIVRSFADLAIAHCESPFEVVTISGGIGSEAADTPEKISWEEIIAEADRGLNRAKLEGRNRVGIDRLELETEIAD